MKKISFILTIVFFIQTASAQKRTYIGAEAAVNHDVFEIIDNGTQLANVPFITGYYGLNIRQEVGSAVFIETGLLRKGYGEGIGFKNSQGYGDDNAISAWLIPLRLGTKINIKRNKVHLVPVIGYTFGVNREYGYGDGGSSGFFRSGTDTFNYAVSSKLSLRRTFPLLQTGIGIECPLFRVALLSIAANYYTGFKNLIEQDITYTHNSRTYTAKGLGKGETLSFGIAVKLPVSGLQTKARK